MHSVGSFRCSLREEGRAFSFVCLRYLNFQAIDWHPQAMRDFNRRKSENSFLLHAAWWGASWWSYYKQKSYLIYACIIIPVRLNCTWPRQWRSLMCEKMAHRQKSHPNGHDSGFLLLMGNLYISIAFFIFQKWLPNPINKNNILYTKEPDWRSMVFHSMYNLIKTWWPGFSGLTQGSINSPF